MSKPLPISRRIAAAVASGCAGLALASTAEAIDLRDWGRKLPASERFVVLSQFGNQAVLDKETQLVWERSPSATAYKFDIARNRCTTLQLGGRLGWRLPAASELRSLIDPSISDPGLPALPGGHPFVGIGPTTYWTSTKHSTLDHRLVTYFSAFNAPAWTLLDSQGPRAWCVRGAGSFAD